MNQYNRKISQLNFSLIPYLLCPVTDGNPLRRYSLRKPVKWHDKGLAWIDPNYEWFINLRQKGSPFPSSRFLFADISLLINITGIHVYHYGMFEVKLTTGLQLMKNARSFLLIYWIKYHEFSLCPHIWKTLQISNSVAI